VLGLLTIPLQQLLIGGALTGVVLGIAAQQSLANLFAGVVLLGTRAVTGRSRVRVHSGALGGPLDGHVVEMGLMYTILDADGETIHVPNSALPGSAISTFPEAGPSDSTG
jgi:small-conductance mechanosensitive channel